MRYRDKDLPGVIQVSKHGAQARFHSLPTNHCYNSIDIKSRD